MIDSLPISSLPLPATTIPPSEPMPPAPSLGTVPAAGAPVQGRAPSPGQPSFASALQSRLRSIADNKATPAVPAIVPELGDFARALPTDAALPKGLTLTPVGEKQAMAQSWSALHEPLLVEEEQDATSTPALALQAPDPAATVLMALNVASPAAERMPLQNAAAGSAESGTAPRDGGLPKAAAQATSDRPAILAGEPEKRGLQAANSATMDNPKGDFAQKLRDALPGSEVPGNQVAAAHATLGSVPAASREIASPVASARWATDVGSHLVWMTTQRESRADLVLNPPQLGRIEVSITISGDQVSASFVSANPEVRDALQGSLPRLREVLADAGVFLGQANIGAESSRQDGGGPEKGGKSPDDSISPPGSSLLGLDDGSLSNAAVQPAIRGRGLIDLFA